MEKCDPYGKYFMKNIDTKILSCISFPLKIIIIKNFQSNLDYPWHNIDYDSSHVNR